MRQLTTLFAACALLLGCSPTDDPMNFELNYDSLVHLDAEDLAETSRAARGCHATPPATSRVNHGDQHTMNLTDLQKRTIPELIAIAKEFMIPEAAALKKQELIFRILRSHLEKEGQIFGEGVLEVLPEGFGFFDHHLGHLNVALGGLIEGRADDLTVDRALHIGDLLGALVDEQDDE